MSGKPASRPTKSSTHTRPGRAAERPPICAVRSGTPDGRGNRAERRVRPGRALGSRQTRRVQLWLGTGNREPLTSAGIYQLIARRGRQCGVAVHPHRFRHRFSHTWLDRGGPEGDLMELNGWASPEMLTRYGASARARRTYDRIMTDT
jgi:integrase